MDQDTRSPSIFTLVLFMSLIVALAATLIIASDVVLILVFAVLFSVFLYQVTEFCTNRFPVSYGQGLCLTTAFVLFSLLAMAGTFGVQINNQIDNSREYLAKSERKLRSIVASSPILQSTASSTPILREIVDRQEKLPPSEWLQDDSGGQSENDEVSAMKRAALQNSARQIAGAISSLFKTTFGLLVNSLLIFFVGLFLAISPASYRDGVVRLFGLRKRDRVQEILNRTGDVLWKWLLGRFASMVITGAGAGLLLVILGIPMALTLGLVTALLTFIPNIGGLISLLLAVLFSLPQGTFAVWVVVIGYLVLQLIESYVITPIIQKRQVSLPPAFLLAFQALMGVLFGMLGAAAASPILAAGKTIVEMAYIEDYLENQEPKPDESS